MLSSLNTLSQSLLWVFQHPVLAVVMTILSIYLIQKVVIVVDTLVNKAMFLIVQAPLLFGQFLLQAIFNLFKGLIFLLIKTMQKRRTEPEPTP